jgi:hypothetical protein
MKMIRNRALGSRELEITPKKTIRAREMASNRQAEKRA